MGQDGRIVIGGAEEVEQRRGASGPLGGIHRFEGAWNDPNPPYYGGLQMDLGFQRTYGRGLLARKGTADHIALVGIFDTNGDGTDDLEAVVRDLTRMGIPVDAYYDLRKRAWVGRITEQTRYVVQGAIPLVAPADPNQKAKSELVTGINQALADSRQKGLSVVDFRDFFPRMGYKVRVDVGEDKINQAAARYLGGVTATPPDTGAPNER